ncbi:MAG: hypothetical protein JNL75_07830 [Chitinophagales bacterium]|nr:hypothetical protein [Chitinophagales bacterium]
MKNFSYLVVLLLSMTLAGCGDIGEFTPRVENPDVEWKLSYFRSIFLARTNESSISNEKFDAYVDAANSQIVIVHNFLDDQRAWFGNEPLEVNVIQTANGPEVEIVYQQITIDPSTSANQLGLFKWEIYLKYSQIGKGKYAKVPVKIRRTYKDASTFGFDKVDNSKSIPTR